MKMLIGIYQKHAATGKWYAWIPFPAITQWGATAREAKQKLTDYINNHYDTYYTIARWKKL